MADNMNQENAPKIYIMSRDNYDLIGTGEAPSSAPLEYGNNIFFVRENSSATADCLSLYVGQAKQCDVWDITDDSEVQYDPVTDEVDIPDRYQIRGKIYIYENELSPAEKFIRLFIWDGVSYVSVGGSGGGTSVQVDHITINDDDHILTGAGADLSGKQYSPSGSLVTAGNGAIALNNYPIDESLVSQGQAQNQTASYPIGAGSVTSGTLNKIFGENTLCFGSGNLVQEDCNNNILNGTSNSINSQYYSSTQTRTSIKSSLIQGNGNIVGTSGSNNIVSGDNNTLSSTPSCDVVVGQNNSLQLNSIQCFGNNNTITSSKSFVSGNNNYINKISIPGNPSTLQYSCSDCFGFGNSNSICGSNVFVFGYNNTMNPIISYSGNPADAIKNISIIGIGNKINKLSNQSYSFDGFKNVHITGNNINWNSDRLSDNVFIFGDDICCNREDTTLYPTHEMRNVFCAGLGLSVDNRLGFPGETDRSKFIIGSYNDVASVGSQNTLFIFGNGTDHNGGQSNALVMDADGRIFLTPPKTSALNPYATRKGNVITPSCTCLETIKKNVSFASGDSPTYKRLPDNNSILCVVGNSNDFVGKITFTATNSKLWYSGQENFANENSLVTQDPNTTKDISIDNTNDYSSVICFVKNPNITNAIDLVDNFSSETVNPKIYLLNPDVDISTYTKINILLFKDAWNLCAIVYGYEESSL